MIKNWGEEQVIFQNVFTKPIPFIAVQWDGEVNINLARWCRGYFRPRNLDDGWALVLEGGPTNTLIPGDWVLQDANGNCFRIAKDEFDKTYATERPK